MLKSGLLFGRREVSPYLHIWSFTAGERWVAVQTEFFLRRGTPLTPACEIFAWLDVDMAPNVGSYLVYKLDRFYGLKECPNHSTVVFAHHKLGGAAKSSADSDGPCPIQSTSDPICFILRGHFRKNFFNISFFHCGFQLTIIRPDGLAMLTG